MGLGSVLGGATGMFLGGPIGGVIGSGFGDMFSSPSLPGFDASAAIREQAKQNRVNTFTPYGSTIFDQTPEGRWTSTTSFSEPVQNLWSRQLDITGNPDAYRNYQDQAFAASRRLLDPYYEQQNRQFEQTMANRGLPAGGEAYNTGYANLTDAMNRAYEEAAFNALQYGEQARMNDYNRLAQILARAQGVPTQPIDVTGPMSTAYQGQIANANLANQQTSNLWNALTGLGGAYLMS